MRGSFTLMPSSTRPNMRAQQERQDQVDRDELHQRDVVDRPCAPRAREALRAELEPEGGDQGLGEIRAVGPAAELGVVEDEEDHLAEGERHHQEEEAAGAQRSAPTASAATPATTIAAGRVCQIGSAAPSGESRYTT